MNTQHMNLFPNLIQSVIATAEEQTGFFLDTVEEKIFEKTGLKFPNARKVKNKEEKRDNTPTIHMVILFLAILIYLLKL